MATRTDNLKLSKAETSDAIKSTLTANNQNFDKLDGVITRLKNNQLRGSVSGTEIELTDAGEVESVLHISGNSEQNSRSGKNVLKKGSDYVTKTSCGITFTVNDDDSVTINGANDGTGNSALYLWNSGGTPLMFKAGTYNTRKTGNDNISIVGYDGFASKYYAVANNSRNTVTYDEEVKMTQIYIQIAKGITETFNNFTVYPILVKNTDSIEPYEPYGLQPSPDFPSEIRSVKGKSDNLFDISVKTDNTSFVWTSGADYGATGAVRSDYIPIEGIKEISSNYKFNISFYDKDKAYLGNGEDVTTVSHPAVNSMIMPNNSNIAYFRVAYRPSPTISGNPTDMTTVTDIMLNKGTEALPYQLYGNVPVEVKVEGKNKLQKYSNSGSLTANGVTIIQNSDGTFTLNGTATTNTWFEFVYDFKINTSAQGSYAFELDSSKQYIYSVSVISGTSTGDWSTTVDIGKTASNTKSARPNKPITFSGANGIARGWLMIPTDAVCNNLVVGVQIEEGTTATPYEPYKAKTISLPLGDIELRSTPDARDTFAKVDGVWNKVDYVKAFHYDGSDDEAWGNQSGGADTEVTAMFTMATSLNANYANRISYCNRFKYYTNGSVQNSTDDVEGFNFHPSARYSNYIYFRIKKSLLPTQNIAGWKNWLASNPIEVVFPVKTPAYIPITDQALITALDELEDLILHKGYNYITATAVNGVKAHLDLSYYKDINIVLDNINASILSLGGGASV